MDAGCHLECCFCRVELTGSLLVLYGPGILVGKPGVLFCRVECLETRGAVTGRSLHGMSLVVVVFLGEFL